MKTLLIDNPAALFWASFNSFEVRLPGQAVVDIAQQGSNDAAVAHWAPIIAAQVKADAFRNRPTPAKIRAELAEHGAWDERELEDDAANWRRLVWCAAHNIAEDDAPDCSEPVKPRAHPNLAPAPVGSSLCPQPIPAITTNARRQGFKVGNSKT